MKNEEVQKLAKLRAHVIKFYTALEEPQSATSMMSTRDTARVCEEVINSIDAVIKEYVEFK